MSAYVVLLIAEHVHIETPDDGVFSDHLIVLCVFADSPEQAAVNALQHPAALESPHARAVAMDSRAVNKLMEGFVVAQMTAAGIIPPTATFLPPGVSA